MQVSSGRAVASAFCVALCWSSAIPALAADPIAFNRLDQSGDEVTGPAKITIVRINPLRFDNARLATDAKLDPVLDVTTVFAGLFKAGAGSSGSPSAIERVNAASPDAVGRLLSTYQKLVTSVTVTISQVDGDARTLALAVQKVDELLKSETIPVPDPNDKMKSVNQSSVALSLDQIRGALNKVKFGTDRAGSTLDWPFTDIAQLKSDIFVQQQTFSMEPDKAGDIAKKMKVLDALAKQVDTTFGNDSSLKKDYDDKTRAILAWIPVFQGVQTADRFEVSKVVGCPNSLQATHTTVSFKATDRLDPSKKVEVLKSITTVNCYSRLALTQGAMFAPVRDRTFVVASAPQTGANPAANVQTVQLSKDGPNRVLGEAAMLHFRLFGDIDKTAAHLTFGAPDQTQTFAGLTLSFNRALFFSVGAIRVQTNSLTNGFSLGQIVPSGTTLTTTGTTSTKLGYGLSIPLSASLAGGKTVTPDKSKDNAPAAQPPAAGAAPRVSASPTPPPK